MLPPIFLPSFVINMFLKVNIHIKDIRKTSKNCGSNWMENRNEQITLVGPYINSVPVILPCKICFFSFGLILHFLVVSLKTIPSLFYSTLNSSSEFPRCPLKSKCVCLCIFFLVCLCIAWTCQLADITYLSWCWCVAYICIVFKLQLGASIPWFIRHKYLHILHKYLHILHKNLHILHKYLHILHKNLHIVCLSSTQDQKKSTKPLLR